MALIPKPREFCLLNHHGQLRPSHFRVMVVYQEPTRADDDSNTRKYWPIFNKRPRLINPSSTNGQDWLSHGVSIWQSYMGICGNIPYVCHAYLETPCASHLLSIFAWISLMSVSLYMVSLTSNINRSVPVVDRIFLSATCPNVPLGCVALSSRSYLYENSFKYIIYLKSVNISDQVLIRSFFSLDHVCVLPLEQLRWSCDSRRIEI